jgi:hypothetical protein
VSAVCHDTLPVWTLKKRHWKGWVTVREETFRLMIELLF